MCVWFIILCFVYVFLFVTVWLSVPVQSIDWKDFVSKITCCLSSRTLNTHSVTHSPEDQQLTTGHWGAK